MLILDWIKNDKIKKNSYLYGIVFLLIAKFILFIADFPTLAYANIVLNIFPYNSFTQNLVELSSFIFITLITVFFARKIFKISWNTLGFSKKSAIKEFIKGWAFGAIIVIICVALMIMAGAVKIDKLTFDYKIILQFIPLVIVWSIQGNAEEVLTRSFLFTGIARKINILVAILVSSIFFTLMHLGNDGIAIIPLLDLFIFGIFAALVVMKTKNIWLISGFHASWNCFQGNVFAFNVSGINVGTAFINVKTYGPSWLSGGKFGIEGSIISILVQVILVLWLCYDLFVKEKNSVLDKFDINEKIIEEN